MSEYLIKHTFFITLFFLIPLLGWFLHKGIPKKKIAYIFYSAIVLLLPAIVGYSCIVDTAYGILTYILLSSGYALILIKGNFKNWITFVLSAVLFCLCFMASLLAGFAGSITIEKKWHQKGYRIEHVQNQGFGGTPLLTYELSKYAWIPLFIKHVDTEIDDHSCQVNFEKEKVRFDKCSGTIEK